MLPRLTSASHLTPAVPVHVYHLRGDAPISLHWHEFYEISFVLAGEGVHLLNGTPYPLTQGSIFLLTPADVHALTPAAGATIELYNAIFSDQALDEELYHIVFGQGHGRIAVLAGAAFRAMRAEFQRLWTEVCEPADRLGSDLVMRGTLTRILIDLARHCRADIPAGRSDASAASDPIRAALVYMHHHFREPLTLAVVAGQVGLSPAYFSEPFHRATGAPFQAYLQELRARFAVSLLCASTLPVTEVCYASGFNTMSHFERVCRRKFGRSPPAVRESYRAQCRRAAGEREECIRGIG